MDLYVIDVGWKRVSACLVGWVFYTLPLFILSYVTNHGNGGFTALAPFLFLFLSISFLILSTFYLLAFLPFVLLIFFCVCVSLCCIFLVCFLFE